MNIKKLQHPVDYILENLSISNEIDSFTINNARDEFRRLKEELVRLKKELEKYECLDKV